MVEIFYRRMMERKVLVRGIPRVFFYGFLKPWTISKTICEEKKISKPCVGQKLRLSQKKFCSVVKNRGEILYAWYQTKQPITLHTDASDYGVGGYLFQTVDCIDQPVAFVSKSLNKSQLRWSVIQMEAYGIFHSYMYLQSLLNRSWWTKNPKLWANYLV